MQPAHKEKHVHRGYTQGETKRLVIEAERLGLSIFDVMERSGKSYASIYNACRFAGIKLKQRKKRAEYGSMKALAFLADEQRMSSRDMSEKYGVTVKSISNSANQYGVKLRKHNEKRI